MAARKRERLGDGSRKEELATALFSLAFHSLPDRAPAQAALDAAHPGWAPLPTDQALNTLAGGFGTIPQLVILDSVVRLASTRSQDLFADAESPTSVALDGVLHNLVPATSSVKAPGPAPALGVVAPDVVARLHDMVVNVSVGGQPVTPSAVVEQVASQLNYHGGQWTVPLCVDDRVAVGRIRCNRITLTFSTSRTVAEMAPYMDPRNWPHCSAYFAGMETFSLDPRRGGPHWIGVFDEKIVGLPGPPMVNPLQFSYDETWDATTSTMTCVQNTYQLLTKTPQLLVDEGYMYAKQVPDPGDGMTTYVEIAKIVKFVNPTILRVWPDFPCATYWRELGLDMAANCSDTLS